MFCLCISSFAGLVGDCGGPCRWLGGGGGALASDGLAPIHCDGGCMVWLVVVAGTGVAAVGVGGCGVALVGVVGDGSSFFSSFGACCSLGSRLCACCLAYCAMLDHC